MSRYWRPGRHVHEATGCAGCEAAGTFSLGLLNPALLCGEHRPVCVNACLLVFAYFDLMGFDWRWRTGIGERYVSRYEKDAWFGMEMEDGFYRFRSLPSDDK